MITIPKTFCAKVNCKNLIDFKEKFCDKHKEEMIEEKKEINKYNEKKRYENNKDLLKIYNNQTWKDIRRNVLSRDNYMCLYCLYHGKYTQAKVVDHYIPVRDSFDKKYDADNLVSACYRCNNLKAYDEEALRENRMSRVRFDAKWKYQFD